MAKKYYKTNYAMSKKEKVIAKYNKQIEAFKLLVNIIENNKQIIQKFDGKILNKRLVTAIKEKQGQHTSVTLNWPDYNKGRIEISLYGDERSVYINGSFIGYIDTYSWTFDVICNNEQRIIANKTINNINMNVEYIQQQITELIDCVENFDIYMQKAKEMENMIAKYEEEVPYRLRLQMTVSDIRCISSY